MNNRRRFIRSEIETEQINVLKQENVRTEFDLILQTWNETDSNSQ